MSNIHGSNTPESRAAKLIGALDAPGSTPPVSPVSVAAPKTETAGDKAVAGMFDLLGLLFALPFGEDLYKGIPLSSIPATHWVYVGVGLCCAGVGHMWPVIKIHAPSLVQKNITLLAQHRAVWFALAIAIFFYGVGPEIYQRINTAPVRASTADEIADAVLNKLPKAPPPIALPNVPSADEIANAVAQKFPALAAAQSGKSASPSAEEIEKINALNGQLDDEKKRSASLQSELIEAQKQREAKTMDAGTAIGMIDWLKLQKGAADFHGGLIVTSDDGHAQLRMAIDSIITAAFPNVTLLPPLDPTDLDAPKLAKPEQPGLTIYGNNPLTESLRPPFKNCFRAYTASLPDSLSKYYKTESVTWISIGPDNPWSGASGVWGQCYDR